MLDKIIFGWKGTAITGTVALALGLTGGWKAHSIKTDADTAKTLKVARLNLGKDLKALQIKLDAEVAERLRLSKELETAQGQTRTITREIIKEVPSVTKISTPECDYSLPSGLISLHNLAATGSAVGSEGHERSPVGLSGGLPASEYVSDYP